MAWTLIAVAAILVHRPLPRLALDLGGLAGLAIASAAWLFGYPRTWSESPSPLLAHPGLWTSFALAVAALGALAWLRRASPTVPDLLRILPVATLALLLCSTSLEVARIAAAVSHEPTARKAAVSIWWGLVATGLIVAGFLGRAPLARRIGLGLLATAMIKAVALDLGGVPQVWRVASFVGLGLLMLAVAAGYAKASSLLGASKEAAA